MSGIMSGLNLNRTVQGFPKALQAAWARVILSFPSLSLMGAAAVLGVGGGVGLMEAVLPTSAAQAQTAPLSQSLQRLPQEPFEAFIQRAEVAADAMVDQYFSQYPQANQIAVTVIGANQGLQAPVLSVDVTRSQWQSRPNLEQWATYFPSTRTLLGFVSPTSEDDSEGLPEAAPDAGTAAQTDQTTDGVIQTPQDGSLSGGASVDEDDSTTPGPIQPETSITTPLEEVAPLEVDPDAGVTDSGDNFDFEDTNDFEFTPDEDDEDTNVVDPSTDAIQPETSITTPASEVAPLDVAPPSDVPGSDATDLNDRPEVIEEPAGR
ncbi:MAG: hypothetical protein VKK04_02735 [Synechococcales bacterium]|nr:hypothetical protein [Synechococcales bacterium]